MTKTGKPKIPTPPSLKLLTTVKTNQLIRKNCVCRDRKLYCVTFVYLYRSKVNHVYRGRDCVLVSNNRAFSFCNRERVFQLGD